MNSSRRGPRCPTRLWHMSWRSDARQVSCTTDDSHMWLTPFIKADYGKIARESERGKRDVSQWPSRDIAYKDKLSSDSLSFTHSYFLMSAYARNWLPPNLSLPTCLPLSSSAVVFVWQSGVGCAGLPLLPCLPLVSNCLPWPFAIGGAVVYFGRLVPHSCLPFCLPQ